MDATVEFRLVPGGGVVGGLLAVLLFAEVEGEAFAFEGDFFFFEGETFAVGGDAVIGEFIAGGLAGGVDGFPVFEEFAAEGEARGVFGFAMFVGEDAMEVDDERGAGFWIGSEGEGALGNEVETSGIEAGFAAGEEVEEQVDGRCAFGGDFELVSKVKKGAVTMEGGGGELDAEVEVELLLGFGEGLVAEEVVDEIEFFGAQVGELGERSEG